MVPDDFDILYSAIKMTGLADMLDRPGPFTFFWLRPTEDAFQKLLGKHPYKTLSDLLAHYCCGWISWKCTTTEKKPR
jgi:uncharacterized surface protein with fasciclin (FAS1) repeats